MTEQYPQAAPQPAPAPELKPKVVQAAAAAGLGTLREAFVETNPFSNALFAGILGAVCVGVIVLVSWLGVSFGLGFLRYFVCVAGVGLIYCIYMLIGALVRGFRATYAYDQGLLHTKNGKVLIVPWTQLDEVLLWKAGGNTSLRGKLLSYGVIGFDGTKFTIAPQYDKEKQEPGSSFGEKVCAYARQLGRPVKDSGPYVGRMRF